MKIVLTTLLALAILFNTKGFAQKYSNQSTSLKGKKILLFYKNGPGYVHENIGASRDAFLKLSREQKFSIDTSSNSEVFTDQNLKQYHAIVFSNSNYEVFDNESQKLAFMHYIQAGGGFVGIHSACATEPNWHWFKQMVGGTFIYHPPFQDFNALVLDKNHPSTKNIPEVWLVKDELYILKEVNPTIRILMVSDFSKIVDAKDMPQTFGTVFPSAWCNTFDGGKQWCTTLGHDKSNYQNPLFLQFIVGGIEWAICKKLDYSKAYSTKSE